ncbi:hypothetical protein PPTG_04074 [Phytophthora nicotianae INRA-310]|uniref:B30.2/SPRY domain-containing protein n=1 Tax=Phytophthora nicotianae (strain INRA-310) TaxID=761204 RepID=W2QZR7_PHYN3|nr:hypothetical protein PPTG_04074 [Phytophthora nicotianae INRA-310]ETN18476.1 hypothetical protein PPTG_04074 [Phytophthora nicotianae INRA-310]
MVFMIMSGLGLTMEYAAIDPWSKDDAIGCLLNLDKGTVAFTRNGVDLGVAFWNVKHTASDQGFFPAISVEQTEMLLVNIGSQPFVYEMCGFEPVIMALEDEDAKESKPTEAPIPVKQQNNGNSSKKVKTETSEDSRKKSEKEAAPTEPPIDLKQFETVDQLEDLRLERLKQELSRRDLKYRSVPFTTYLCSVAAYFNTLPNNRNCCCSSAF